MSIGQMVNKIKTSMLVLRVAFSSKKLSSETVTGVFGRLLKSINLFNTSREHSFSLGKKTIERVVSDFRDNPEVYLSIIRGVLKSATLILDEISTIKKDIELSTPHFRDMANKLKSEFETDIELCKVDSYLIKAEIEELTKNFKLVLSSVEFLNRM